jgi:hypothetical protein
VITNVSEELITFIFRVGYFYPQDGGNTFIQNFGILKMRAMHYSGMLATTYNTQQTRVNTFTTMRTVDV